MRSCRSGNRWRCSTLAPLLALSLTAAAGPVPARRVPQLFSCFGIDPDRLDDMAKRYAVVIWHNHPDLRRALAELKRRNPRLTGLMYRELFCVLQHEGPLGESVGRYAWISTHHPDWFQLDTNGHRVEIPDYPGRWMMDLGHPDWQALWIEETLQEVIRGGWDGVFADDALTTIRAHRLPPLAGYPDDASLQRAVSQLLARAHAAFQRAGKLLIANVSSSYFYPGLWDRWLDVTDGLMEEHFTGEAWGWGEFVAQRQLEAAHRAAQHGKRVFCFTYGAWDDRVRMETSLAAYLVIAGPQSVWSYRPSDDADRAPWDPSGESSLGQPQGDAQQSGAVWWRRFEHGLAVVNTASTPQTLTVEERSLSMKPHQGAILLDGTRAQPDGAESSTSRTAL
ncbi:MAG: hypothetical protein HYZ89_06550 [Candidatus Omnitrophica bacterium]|nr:hypothetical protein [Candidatus Omnitrophota bacterium]